MDTDNQPPQRRSIRLENYDYSNEGAYFVTICVQDKKFLFGKIVDAEMQLSKAGKMIEKWLLELKRKFSNANIDEYSFMPNHVHAIIWIVGADLCVCPPDGIAQTEDGRTHRSAPTDGEQSVSLPQIIQWFKTMATNEYIRGVKSGKFKPFKKRLWPRNYYEHVIRDEDDLNEIRQYIIDNPANWANDEENPDTNRSP
jgi:REP element-mobilizing transposase RayT